MNEKQRLLSLRIVFVFCCLGILGNPASLSAFVSSQFGFSPRAIAMGNAYTALSDDFSGLYYNPAGLATRPRNAGTMGYLYNQPRVKVQGADGVTHLAFDAKMNSALAGLTMDMGDFVRQFVEMDFVPKKLRPDIELSWGLAVASPNNFSTFVDANIGTRTDMQFPVFGRDQDLMPIFGGGGMKLHKMVYVGGAIVAGFSCALQTVDATVNFFDPDNLFTYNKLDVNPTLEMAPLAGIIIMPLDELRIGATWRGSMNPVHFLGTVNVVIATPVGDILLPSLATSLYDLYQPEEISVSIAYESAWKLLVAFELSYAKWSGFNLPYGSAYAGNLFENILIWRGGLEYNVTEDAKVRLGYYYQPSPLNDVPQTMTQFLDTDQHVFSTGLGYVWRFPERFLGHPVEFDLYLQYHHLPRRTLDTVAGPMSLWGYHIGGGGTIQLQF